MTRRSVAAVVLAAGASSRMGRPKPLLPLAASNYLETLRDKLVAAGADPVVIVLGSGARAVRAATDLHGATVIENLAWQEGMLSSIHTALEYLEGIDIGAVGAMLLQPVDQPRVATDTFTTVIDRWAAQGAPVTVAAHNGRRGHPVIFDRVTWPALRAASPASGAREVVHQQGAALVEVAVEDPWVLIDADTPADHDAMWRGETP